MSAPPGRANAARNYTSAKRKICSICGEDFNVKGLASHEAACARSQERLNRDRQLAAQIAQAQRDAEQERFKRFREEMGSVGTSSHIGGPVPGPSNIEHDYEPIPLGSQAPQDVVHDGDLQVQMGAQLHEVGDIKTQYHPKTGKASMVQSKAAYDAAEEQFRTPPQPPDNPWRPYRTRSDFGFADIALSACLNEEHVEALIKLIKTVASGQDQFTISSHAELRKLRQSASAYLTPYQEMKIQVPYEDEVRDYKVWACDLWDWATDQLHDPRLTPHWAFDSLRLFRWSGTKWVRFRDEPWTANMLWEVQSVLPEGGTPFGFIVYADKTKLSSFGTQKGYPVMVRCAQLPIEIRNGNGIGGGAIVGWLPVIDEGTAEEGKKNFVDHKRIVWHEAFYLFIKKIEVLAKTGFQCDLPSIMRNFYPFLVMLVADYEEQCFMAMIRGGHQSLCNCPRCLAKSKDLTLLEQHAIPRTPENMQAVLAEAQAPGNTRAAADKVLKDYGLRGNPNVFWKLLNTNPYRALSFDKLHAYDSGLLGDHIWPETVSLVTALGRWAIAKVDEQASSFPIWRGLTHFKQVVNINFNDGHKFQDLSKIIPYVVHNVIATELGSQGHLLLCLLRKYLELDMYFSFRVQTEDTIAAIRTKLLEFSQCLKEETGPDGKDWNFPKVHSHQHGPEDIEDKGITANYNTKPFEKMHGSLKKSYLRRSNKRNVENQLLTAEHDLAVMQIIRANIEDYDAFHTGVEEEDDEDDPDDNSTSARRTSTRVIFDDRISFGAPEKPKPLAELQNHVMDLHKDVTTVLDVLEIRSRNGDKISVGPHDEVVEYRFLKVSYESEETWKQETDFLRCTPSWFGKERRDHVIIDTAEGPIFACLLMMFTCTTADGDTHPFVIVKPLDGPVEPQERDRVLGFYRVQPSAYDVEVLPAQAIIRGALVTPDHGSPAGRSYFVVDNDPDMFCRLNSLRRNRFR
ncbi:uncharacterized protein C8Q71DRAFT_826723 [Rhodofomes roseus]|uniref:Uncharacterized protein n=1 Tax=Rhodofomes roseus TaxID=34475 RepID=A0ABQ8KY67_9APHY|nr:uncharacterized protein C8Q71DRAFT_826723 [Rhodofomes roseus]KAH9844247.1 hypothetical protein C8Q71DRAFT_826723 [Rhodofomes roseus]